MFKVGTFALIFLLVLFISQGHADPSISPSSSTPCYGEVLTLVCRHPDLASNRGRYLDNRPTWRKNGKSIDTADGTIYSAETAADLILSFLNITIAADYFRNEPFNFSCELILAENGLPTGEVETSENITVGPVEPLPPSGINIITSRTTSIAINWTHIPVECYKNRIRYYVSWVNIDNNTENGSDVTGEHMYNITGLVPDITYTISVRTVLDGNDQSTAVSLNGTTASGLIHSPPPPTDNLPYLALIIIVVVLLGGCVVVATRVCLWSKRKSQRIGCNNFESLWLLQVTDSLNRNGVKIISVQGHCVSIECAPCHCRREATTVDIYGTFNEKSFVLNIVQRGNGSLEEFIAELLQQKSILSADYCFALWAGGSVLRKVRSQFEKEPGWKKGDCEIFPLQGFPWKVGSKEERRFVQLFKACHPPLPIKTLGFRSQEGEVTLAVAEIEEATVTIPHSDPPQVDVVKLVELLLISKPPTTEETDEDVEIPIESANTSVNKVSLDKGEPVNRQRLSYTRASFIGGVVSALEILHVTILSVGNSCRRFECRDANSCTHLNTFQPDVVGVCGDTSFVIKCVLHRHDGDVTGEHVVTLNNVKTGLGLPLGLLMYDHMEGDPQLLSQQMPDGCSLVHVGAFTWDSDWVESTLIALCKAFKTPLAVDTHPPVHPEQHVDIPVDKDSSIPNPPEEMVNHSAIGEKAAQLVEDEPPPVPPKKETNPGPMEEQFQTDVIEALTEIGMTLHLRERDLFTAIYQSMGFLGVSWVESEKDVTPTDVEKVVRVKTKMAASRAVLICNQDTIPSDRLVDLQNASCYFIKAGGYGTEKWKNRLVSNFKETVGAWMKEQNSGLHHSEKEEGGVGPPEEDEEVVGHPKEESGLNQPVEEAGAPGRSGPVQGRELIIRKPPTTGITRLDSVRLPGKVDFTAYLDGLSLQSSIPQHVHDGQGENDECAIYMLEITDVEMYREPVQEVGHIGTTAEMCV